MGGRSQSGQNVIGGDGGRGEIVATNAGALKQGRWRLLAEAEAGTALPCGRRVHAECSCRAKAGFQPRAQRVGASGFAGDVVAHVDDRWGLWLGGEEGIEAGDAIGFRGRNGEPRAEVVQRPRADPPDARLNGMEDGQQKMPAVTRRRAPFGLASGALVARSPRPSGIRPPQNFVYGCALVVTAGCVRKMQVQCLRTLQPARRCAYSYTRKFTITWGTSSK